MELTPCCLPPVSAISMPESWALTPSKLSYRNFGDFMKIPEPQPRSIDPSPMTDLSGFLGLDRRNLQG